VVSVQSIVAAEPARWEGELLVLFARNQRRAAFAMPLLAAICAMLGLLWVSPLNAILWFGAVACAQAIQSILCLHFVANAEKQVRLRDRIGMIAASEFLLGAVWSLQLFLFWDHATVAQRMFMAAAVMGVIPIRIMIAANFMPLVLAGTSVMTAFVAARCALAGEALYLALGAMAITLEIVLVQIARRLQETARDMLVFKAERERLIEELRREKEAAETAKAGAEAASEAKSRFLATVSHELRTPLNAILGFSEILSKQLFGPDATETYRNYASDINSSGAYLLNLIDGILDLSRIEAGARDLDEVPLDIAETARDALRLIDFGIRRKKQTLHDELPADLPQLLADRRAVRQIWINLLSNAVKFTPENGRIAIKAWRTPSSAITIAVRDTGPGIPENEIAAAMSPFARGSYATKKAIDGAGLGLPIVKGLAALHGAEIAILSEPGRGTVVTVTFPAYRVLTGPHGEVIATASLTPGQRRLIALTG
jgi:two-component system cell cycle sensor histidine kinase PleC